MCVREYQPGEYPNPLPPPHTPKPPYPYPPISLPPPYPYPSHYSRIGLSVPSRFASHRFPESFPWAFSLGGLVGLE